MDATDGNQIISILALSLFFGAFVLAILVVFSRKTEKDDETKNDEKKSGKEKKDGTESKVANEKKKIAAKQKAKAKDAAFTHPMLLTTLKGHTGVITQMEFSRCGKYLGSCSEGKLYFLMERVELNSILLHFKT